MIRLNMFPFLRHQSKPWVIDFFLPVFKRIGESFFHPLTFTHDRLLARFLVILLKLYAWDVFVWHSLKRQDHLDVAATSASSQRSFQGNELMRVHDPKKLAFAFVSSFFSWLDFCEAKTQEHAFSFPLFFWFVQFDRPRSNCIGKSALMPRGRQQITSTCVCKRGK